MRNKKTIIISVTSDISMYLCKNVFKNDNIIGTYNTGINKLKKINSIKSLIKLNVKNHKRLPQIIKDNKKKFLNWENCIISVGSQKPIGLFKDLNYKEISDSIDINFKNQIILLRLLLPLRKKNGIKNVLTWAGPGTNSANKLYYPYTISKIALIKSMELLDHEIKDVKFCILGPGWVKTKIHKETLKNKKRSKENFYTTLKVLNGLLKIDTALEEINNCVAWILKEPKKIVGGKNFSVKNDNWNSKSFIKKIIKNPDFYKLRRKS